MKLDEYPFAFNIRNLCAFQQLGITTLEELLATPERALLRCHNHGRISVDNIINELARHGIVYPPGQNPPPQSPDQNFIRCDFT